MWRMGSRRDGVEDDCPWGEERRFCIEDSPFDSTQSKVLFLIEYTKSSWTLLDLQRLLDPDYWQSVPKGRVAE